MARCFAFLFILLLSRQEAVAEDARCEVPPYGMSDQEFKQFVDLFGHIVTPARTLPIICNMKFGGGDRTALYNLGFTDQDIDSKRVGVLTSEMILALKKLSDKIR